VARSRDGLDVASQRCGAALRRAAYRVARDAYPREGSIRMNDNAVDSDDHVVVGKIGRVTGTVGPGRTGEVVIPVRGGSEAFLAFAAENGETIPAHARVVVVEYQPPRTVYVTLA
jgi:hypothetical protein